MSNENVTFETRLLSSLTKVFADEELQDKPVAAGTALWKEVYSFQAAYRSSVPMMKLQVEIDSELAPYVQLRSVGLSPSELPVFPQTDDNYLRTTPGLYPDPLYPWEGSIRVAQNQWRSLWVTVELPSKQVSEVAEAASYPINIHFIAEDGNRIASERYTLDVIPAELPEQRLKHTEWFHTDCLATYYGEDVFSEQHWRIIEQFVRNAVDHGVNMLLTPIFTPPLDTAIGGERRTVQLVGVEVTGEGRYKFDFTKLERWVDMCLQAGVQYFEFSHLFTQWGAKHAPKIVATTDGQEQRIFGWETEATGPAYRQFLDQFLPELVGFIRRRGLEQRSYFHVSDEPVKNQVEDYRQARAILQEHLGEFSFIEALSDYDFYEQGLVPIPIPANNHIEPFLENNVDNLWTYYCCGQPQDVSNRFFSMPSARNRILGLQLYKYNIKGFLHWGFNFWNTQYSVKAIDPFRVTDAGQGFPSGDAFVVYPGAEGPIDSLRWEVFREALQDLRALELLESLAGREEALRLIESCADGELTFSRYPTEKDWLLGTRAKINQAIRDKLFA